MFVISAGIEARLNKFLVDQLFGLLTWESSKPNDYVDFLDLTISINKIAKCLQKPTKKSLNPIFTPLQHPHTKKDGQWSYLQPSQVILP